MMILKGNAPPSYDYVICFSKFELRFFLYRENSIKSFCRRNSRLHVYLMRFKYDHRKDYWLFLNEFALHFEKNGSIFMGQQSPIIPKGSENWERVI